MKGLLIFLLMSSQIYSKALDQMQRRIKIYNESDAPFCEGTQLDDGLFIDVSCEFQCSGKEKQIERVRGAFIPKNLGLFPGNGSNENNTLWSSVGVSMKSWSGRICLDKASQGCSGIQNVSSVHLKNIESGDWKIERFPDCKEKKITLSPFNDSIKSNRIPKITTLLEPDENVANLKTFKLKIEGFEISLPFADFTKKNNACEKTIKASLCFGDCIDLDAASSSDFVETLGTSDPLGFEQVEICADELAQKMISQNLPTSAKQQVCEAFFWESLIKSSGMMKSCAALRGEVTCDSL